MSDQGTPFLPPDLRRLIDSDRLEPDPPSFVREEMARRLDRALHLGGALMVPVAAPPPDPLEWPAPSPALPSPRAAALYGWKVVTGAALAVAVAGGLLSYAVLSPGSAGSPAPSVDAPIAAVNAGAPLPKGGAAATSSLGAGAPSSLVAGASSAVAGEEIVIERASAGGRGARAAGRPVSGADSLSRERTMLDRARTALLRRDPSAALAALRVHERAFRRGKLVEERESMRVQALSLSSDHVAARAAAQRFRRRFPGSVFATAIDRVLEGGS